MIARIISIFLYGPYRIGAGFLVGLFFARLCGKVQAGNFRRKLDDASLELLLRFMDIYLQIDKNFRLNIKGFDGKYLFKTKTSPGRCLPEGFQEIKVEAAFSFEDDNMTVEGNPNPKRNDYDAIVIFDDSKALRDSLKGILIKGQLDVLDLMLESKIQVCGNMNYVFKFLFLVNDLRCKFPFKVR